MRGTARVARRPLRLLWVSHSAKLGGAELVLEEAASALRSLGHEIHVVLPCEGPLAQALGQPDSVSVVHVNRWMSRPPLPPVLTRLLQLRHDYARAAPAIAQVAKRVSADVVISNTICGVGAALAARRSGLPHAWYLHEFGDLDHGMQFHFGPAVSHRAISKLSFAVLVNSETLRAHFSTRLPDARLHVVRYAVETAPGLREDAAEDGVVRLLVLAQRSQGKGQIDAVRALACLRDRGVAATLELVGGSDPNYDAELLAAVRQMHLEGQVRLEPFSPDRLRRLAAADVVLVCSRSEAFGRVTVEAMKLGRAVIGAAAGATPELVRDGETGLLYRVGDAADLAAKIECLARDQRLRSALGRSAREWALREFTRERFARDLLEALGRAKRW